MQQSAVKTRRKVLYMSTINSDFTESHFVHEDLVPGDSKICHLKRTRGVMQ